MLILIIAAELIIPRKTISKINVSVIRPAKKKKLRELTPKERQKQKVHNELSKIPTNPFLEDPTNLSLIFSKFPQLCIETQQKILVYCIIKIGEIAPRTTSGPLTSLEKEFIKHG